MSDLVELGPGRRTARVARCSSALLVAALVGAGLGACGGARHGAGSASGSSSGGDAGRQALPRIETSGDEDFDSDTYPHAPDNENEVFGHPANATDTRLVTALVKRYYAAAAREQGAVACGLLYSVFEESVASTYGGPGGPPSLRGGTCAVVMTKLFKEMHQRLSDGGTVRVAAVRVDLNRASAQFGFGGRRATQYTSAHRERGAWKMYQLLDIGRPVIVE
jgi:hypothetical protein